MRKIAFILLTLALALPLYGLLTDTISAQASKPTALFASEGILLTATLLDDNEVPEVVGDASGFANIAITSTEICYEIEVTGLTGTATFAHIHTGAAGATGDVIVNFVEPDENGVSGGCSIAPDVETAEIEAILANPAGFYVNVHTAANPGGEVRGQLEAVPTFVTTLTGTAEVSNDGVPFQGDPDGSGSAIVSVYEDQLQVCYELAVVRIEAATLAHIHAGALGTNGPVDITFDAPTTGSSSGCAAAVAEQLTALLANPSAFYVNVHNTPFPAGAMRGQLTTKQVLSASLDGAFEIPGPADPDGSGLGVFGINMGTHTVEFALGVSNIATATAAHIHTGTADVSGPPVVTLAPPAGGASTGTIDVEPGILIDILTDPTAFYANVHNADFGLGAVRGQLYAYQPAYSKLSGAKEFPGPGDPDGTGFTRYSISLNDLQICYEMTVSNIAAATLAHIHTGASGASGAVYIDLTAPATGALTTCDPATDLQIAAVLANPAGHYTNVHNAEFMTGAVRGQVSLFPLTNTDFTLESPANDSYIRDATSVTEATWTHVPGIVEYTASLIQISNNTRLGVIDEIITSPEASCSVETNICSLPLDLTGLDDGLYSWTVVGASEDETYEAVNGPALVTLETDLIELLTNGSFEEPSANPGAKNATGWNRNNPTGERRDCRAAKVPTGGDGACAYRATAGTPAAITAQGMNTAKIGKYAIGEGDALTLRGLLQAKSKPPAGSRIKIVLKFTAGPKQVINIPLEAATYGDIFDALTPIATPVDAGKGTVRKISVKIISVSKFYLDDLSLELSIPLGLAANDGAIPLPAAPADLRGN